MITEPPTDQHASVRPVVSVLVGLPAAGKSTFVRTVLAGYAVVVSKDDFPKAQLLPPDVDGSYARNAVRVGRARVPGVGCCATLGKIKKPAIEHGFDEVVRLDGVDGSDVRAVDEGSRWTPMRSRPSSDRAGGSTR